MILHCSDKVFGLLGCLWVIMGIWRLVFPFAVLSFKEDLKAKFHHAPSASTCPGHFPTAVPCELSREVSRDPGPFADARC